MTKHFEFSKTEFKNIFGKPTRIGEHRFSGVASFDGENYTYNMFSQTFVRDELFSGQIWLSDYVMREEHTNDIIEAHLQWLFQPDTEEEENDKNEVFEMPDLFETLGNALRPHQGLAT